jgi:signal transduction histidine kinase
LEHDKIALRTPHPLLARKLKAANELIIQTWEDEVKKKVASARLLPKPALRDSLPEFLNRLADALAAENKTETLIVAGKVGRKHGEERARQSNYNISEVLVEYWLLRTAIFEVLESEAPIPLTARNLVLIAVDEGIRQAVEEFAEERTRTLEQSNRDLEHFAAVAAHDLKAPLSTISGYLELISEGAENKVDEDVIGYLKTTRRAAAQMSVMIDRLLEYSSIGKKMEAFTPIEVSKVLEQVLENLQAVIQKSKAEIVFGKLPVVNGEFSLLGMLFQNLISNAIKFKDSQPPHVTISVKETERAWIFSIADNGIGFDPKQADNLFSLFKQFHQPLNHQGFGIGLATARKVVEIHGGQIWAESEPGRGAVFSFSIPK